MGQREHDHRSRRIMARGALLATLALLGPDLVAARAAAAPVTVGVVSSMVQVRPDSAVPPSTPGAQLVAARGEYESFQVVVTGPVDGVAVKGDLFGWGTTALAREDYYTATTQSDREGGVGRWADRLVPTVDPFFGEKRNAFPISVPSGQNRAVWVDVFVPLGMPAATYTGSLRVTATGRTATTVPVSLRVLGIYLPATSSLTSFFGETIDGQVDEICQAHLGSADCGSTTTRAQLHSMYARLALENRVTTSNFGIPKNNAPNYYGTTWEQTLEAPLISGTASYPTTAEFNLQHPRLTTVVPYAYNQRDHCQQTCATAWKAEATEPSDDFSARVLYYGCDEAGVTSGKWTACAKALAKANSGWARPALATSTIANYTMYGKPTGIPISTLVPIIDQIQTVGGRDTRPDYDAFLATPGNRLWLYSSCDSYGCAGDGDSTSPALDGLPGYAIDAPANQARAMSWMVDRYRASGELYYSVDQQLSTANTPGGMFDFGANGDGTLFYPGVTSGTYGIGGTHTIPLESIRLKRIRDGREDYEYMLYLRRHGQGATVDDIVGSLYPTSNAATAAKDGAGTGSLLAARTRLIAAIDALTATPAGRIAFTSDRDGDPEIFSMAADGTDVRQLTRNTVVDDFAAWSPDGTRIAFTRGTGVWVMNADGSGATRLTTGTAATAASKPAWSADGSTLVYVRRTGSGTLTDLWTMNSDGSNPRPFVTYASGGISSYDPTVSPSDVVYFSQSDGSLHRYSLASTGFATVTSGATDEVADVSPDGTRLTFSRTNAAQDQPYDVYLAGIDGSGPVDLTATAAGGATGNDFQSSFAPDGTAVAFASGTGSTAIWTIGVDGAGARSLTTGTAHDSSPDWGPAA